MTDASGYYVSASNPGSTTSRTLAASEADTPNVIGGGLQLNGTNDSTALNTFYGAIPNNTTVYIPKGTWNAPSFTPSPSKTIFWNALGPLVQTSGQPQYSIGDGDLLSNFYGGRLVYSKHMVEADAGAGYASVAMNLTNASQAPTNYGDNSFTNFYATATDIPGATGSIYNILGNANVGSSNGNANNILNISSIVTKTGGTDCWQYYGITTDLTGLNPSGIIVGEFDIVSNGQDTGTAKLYGFGSRIGFHITVTSHFPATWSAGKSITAGELIVPSIATNMTNYNVAIAQNTGTTGTSEPVWPTTYGDTVTDGTVTWLTGVTQQTSLSRAIEVDSSNNASVGTVLGGYATVFGSFVDVSNATLIDSAAAIRMAPNQAIDFSATSDSTLNVRTLQYNSSATALQYNESGNILLSVADSGAVVATAPNTVKVRINDTEGGEFTPIFVGGENSSSNSPIAIDLSGYSSLSPLPNTIRFSANNGHGLTWIYSGSSATLSITWPYFTFSNAISAPAFKSSGVITPGSFAFSALPAASGQSVGALAFCTNGRNTGEGAGAGTGCPAFVKSVSGTLTWCAVWSGIAVTT